MGTVALLLAGNRGFTPAVENQLCVARVRVSSGTGKRLHSKMWRPCAWLPVVAGPALWHAIEGADSGFS